MEQIKLHDGTKVWVRTNLDLCYVIQGDDAAGVIKVGRSANPTQRVASLVSGVPFKAKLVAVMLDGTRRERELKAMLAPYNVHGEWFNPSQELQDYLDEARKGNAVVSKTGLTEDHFRDHLLPTIEAHLNGRQPLMSENGDFIYRVLREGFAVISGRESRLIIAVGGQITPESVSGYLPIAFDQPTPAIRLPAKQSEQAA